MQLPDDFIPEYTFIGTSGIICNANSRIVGSKGRAFISLNSRINLWDINTGELLKTYGTHSDLVTELLLLKEHLIAGYKNGVVEIFTLSGRSVRLRLHSRKITALIACTSGFLSASTDGTIIHYDITLGDVVTRYEGCNSPVYSLFSDEHSVVASCADNSLKIWLVGNPKLHNAFCFSTPISGAWTDGSELVAIMKKGHSLRISIETKEQKLFKNFGRVLNVISRKNILVVRSEKQVYIFNSGLGLQSQQEISRDTIAIDIFEDNLFYLRSSNSFGVLDGPKHSGGHSSPITRILSNNTSRIYTFSRDRIISWLLEHEETPSIHASTELAAKDVPDGSMTGFALFKEHVLVSSSAGIFAYSSDLSTRKECSIKIPCTHLASSPDILAVIDDKYVFFYDDSYQLKSEFELPESAICARFSPDGSLFCVSMINSKIDVFEVESGALKSSIYGHALPVRHFAVSSDNKTLVSCGADRLVKIWGTQLGECKGKLINDALYVEFVHQDLFMFTDKVLCYSDGYRILKQFKYSVTGPFISCQDLVVAGTGPGLALFAMGRYEMLVDSESEEYETVIPNVMEMDTYGRFLDYLDKMAESKDPSVFDSALYSLLEDIELSELDAYLCVLDACSVHTLLLHIGRCIDRNTVLSCRIFILLSTNSWDTCVSNPVFSEIHQSLLVNIARIRDVAGNNIAEISMRLEGFEL